MKKIVLLIITILNFYHLNSQIQIEKTHFISELGFQLANSIFEDSETLSMSIDGATFFTKNIGLRTGITHQGSTMNSKWNTKIPIYFVLATKAEKGELDLIDNYNNSILEDVLYSVLSYLITKSELNIGPSVGYVCPNSETKNLSISQKRALNDYFVNARMSLSLDANLRISYYISKIGINLNFGGSYWLTNNFKYYGFKGDEDDGKVSRWMGSIGMGITYQF